jgi:hypothetical protein
MRAAAKEEIECLSKSFTETLKQWDAKMVKIRNDLDVHVLHKLIDKKADDE